MEILILLPILAGIGYIGYRIYQKKFAKKDD